MNWGTIIKRSVLTAIAAIIIGCVLNGIAALLIQQEMMSLNTADIIAMVISAAVLFFLTYLTVRKIPTGRLLAAVGIGVAYLLLALLIRISAFPMTRSAEVWYYLIPPVISALAGVLASGKKKRRY